ncbi:MBL fold metallo-hydrolase [Amycolatopsis keratiniphila]|uniref:Metallo-beta-lactamase domain-containing protein n=1 Tax=Amycolatopsis keratiniphila TaxID=129921 RepID=R4STC3_9PSEU|nr:MBL fold metallo-hydrolase [Amycolatopsis keratiniphila]AGM06654.1 hypothetical protein AORI_4069 [Amycolatopsis keratiniphila]
MLTQVAAGVLVHQSALLRNNTVVVEGEEGVLLVDPGITEDEMACLANDLAESGRTVVAGFATHPDWDHALWHPAFGDVPRYGTERCAAYLRDLRSKASWKADFAEGLPPEIAGEVPVDLFGLITALPAGSTRIPWRGPELRLIEHPAHAPGHAALVIEESGVLVAGDMLSDVLVPMFDDTADPLADYLAGLRLLDEVADDIEVVVPGHGAVGDAGEARARIDRDRAYVHAVRDGRTPEDPRIGSSAEPGWEWVSDLHAGQVQRLAQPLGMTQSSRDCPDVKS